VVLEGLACGCHVITSGVGGLPEAGGQFAEMVLYSLPEEYAKRISEFWQLPACERPEGVESHLSQFTVQYTAGLLIDYLNDASI
jgi:glycosyltransferase involved in cell wall biosynthesis